MGDWLPKRFSGLGSAEILGVRVPVASTWRSRLFGLAFLSGDRAPAGLLIPRCRSVHTFGMRFPIDVVFLDGSDREIRMVRGMRPRRLASQRGAAAVLELPSRPGGGANAGPGVEGTCSPRSDPSAESSSVRTMT